MLMFSYDQVPPVKDVRKVLRIQALRCHAIYCQSGTRLNVIPVLASRSQALRYVTASTHKAKHLINTDILLKISNPTKCHDVP